MREYVNSKYSSKKVKPSEKELLEEAIGRQKDEGLSDDEVMRSVKNAGEDETVAEEHLRHLKILAKKKRPWFKKILALGGKYGATHATWSYKKPRNMHLARRLKTVLPSREKMDQPKLMALIDVSGSMQDLELSMSCTALAEFGVRIDALIFTTEVVAVVENGTAAEILAEAKKYSGGTDFRPVFEEAEKRIDGHKAILFFSDYCGPFPDKAPSIPVFGFYPEGGESHLEHYKPDWFPRGKSFELD